MAIIDFIKKKELLRIEELSSNLNILHNEIDVLKKENSVLLEKYGEIVDIENHTKEQKEKLEKINSIYQKSLEIFHELRKETFALKETKEYADYGIYEQEFDFEHSEKYRERISENIAKQKELVKTNAAAVCNTDWIVEGSIRKGKVLTNRNIKIVLRAFNGECDAQISKIKWNNCQIISERLDYIYNKLNQLSEPYNIQITKEYYRLKKQRLQLEYELQQKLFKEKEEARALAEEKREEEKALRELEKARRDAERDEIYYTKALDKVKRDIENATGTKYEILSDKIRRLEIELEEARENKERAISMAQQTRKGYVYIISNIGSFGENIFKIGMTRRIDPEDRIRELSNASVPFRYDIHAMILSEDAPSLENELHRTFNKNRLNLINGRKEFFNIDIKEIENKLQELGIDVEVMDSAEARDYRASQTLKNSLNSTEAIEDIIKKEISYSFPSSLFEDEED